jgi:hypothetical protein
VLVPTSFDFGRSSIAFGSNFQRADQVIETSDEDLKLAALSYIASPIKSSRQGDDEDDENEDEGLEIVSTESHRPSED